ncbi:hypothetical protein MKW98_016939, partial [Papaver atlanticum]
LIWFPFKEGKKESIKGKSQETITEQMSTAMRLKLSSILCAACIIQSIVQK